MAPSCITEFRPEQWQGKRLAVELYSILYAALSGNQEACLESVEKEVPVYSSVPGEENKIVSYKSLISYEYNPRRNSSHLVQTFRKSIKMLSLGWKPVMVLDGPPPPQKAFEVKERQNRKIAAAKQLEVFKTNGNYEGMVKCAKEMVQVDDVHKKQVIELLKLLGIPYIQAPHEAESQCAFLCKQGIVDAIISEDSDVLTFGGKTLIRNITIGRELDLSASSSSLSNVKKSKFAESRPASVVSLDTALRQLDLTMEQFVDLCILIGGDYTGAMGGKIAGIAIKQGYKLIKEHKTIENVVKHLQDSLSNKTVPESWKDSKNLEIYRSWFIQPSVDNNICINQIDNTESYKIVDEEVLIQFMLQNTSLTRNEITSSLLYLRK